jgi:CRISPR-associated protein Csd1
MVDAWTGALTPVGLIHLARVTGRWQAGRGGATGSWAKFGASGADRPDGIYQALLRAALLGKALPPKLLTHVINRIRIDGRVDTARVALIRLALRRRPGTKDPEVYMQRSTSTTLARPTCPARSSPCSKTSNTRYSPAAAANLST